MSKVIWGKYIWKALHYISLGYPNDPTEQQKDDYKTFYTLLKSVLPCKICREHYKENLKNHPLSNDALKNKDSLIKWTIDLHNIINEELGYSIMPYNDALNDINSYETSHIINKTDNNNYLLKLIILFSIILMIIYIYKNNIFKK